MKRKYEREEKKNLAFWNEVTPIHYKSYGVEEFKAGKSPLRPEEIAEVGIVQGKELLHLQCHFGMDSLAWEREGAIVTAIDFSEDAIKQACQLRDDLKMKTTFVHSNIYELDGKIQKQFDIVYTSRGVLCWLQDIDEWGRIIARYLKPGGFFYIQEIHPLFYIFDDSGREPLQVKYPYFHQERPMEWATDDPDYADETYIPKNPTYEWLWPLSDIINSLLKAGLQLVFLNETNKLCYKGLPQMVQQSPGWYILPGYEEKIPLTFSLKATKPLE